MHPAIPIILGLIGAGVGLNYALKPNPEEQKGQALPNIPIPSNQAIIPKQAALPDIFKAQTSQSEKVKEYYKNIGQILNKYADNMNPRQISSFLDIAVRMSPFAFEKQENPLNVYEQLAKINHLLSATELNRSKAASMGALLPSSNQALANQLFGGE